MTAELQPTYIHLTSLINEATAALIPLRAQLDSLQTSLTREQNNLNGWINAGASAQRTERINTYNAAISDWREQIAAVESAIFTLESDIAQHESSRAAFVESFDLAIINGKDPFTATEEANAESERIAAETRAKQAAEFVWEWYHYAGIAAGVALIGFVIWRVVKN